QAIGFAWIAARASIGISLVELLLALFVAGIGISMALPAVPTAILNSVAPEEIGTASGVNNMMQRFGAVFAVAIASTVFTSYGSLGSAATVTAGFRPALAVCAALSLIGAASAIVLKSRGAVERDLEPAAATGITA